MSEFKYDQRIEVSNNPTFEDCGLPARFQCDLSMSLNVYTGNTRYVVLKNDGSLDSYAYAREVYNNVFISLEGNEYLVTASVYESLVQAEKNYETILNNITGP